VIPFQYHQLGAPDSSGAQPGCSQASARMASGCEGGVFPAILRRMVSTQSLHPLDNALDPTEAGVDSRQVVKFRVTPSLSVTRSGT
jgi:hypothetical protein